MIFGRCVKPCARPWILEKKVIILNKWYCYAEPTVEVTLPGKEPLVFGHVKKAKVDEIIDLYIRNGELLDDIIPVTYTVVKPE